MNSLNTSHARVEKIDLGVGTSGFSSASLCNVFIQVFVDIEASSKIMFRVRYFLEHGSMLLLVISMNKLLCSLDLKQPGLMS